MAQERSIEVKVGIVILVALVILGAFVLVMSGLSLEKTFDIFVDFDNPGGLQSGAPVRIAGVKVGKVSELEFHGGRIDPKVNRRTLVRARVSIYRKMHESIREDAAFYVTTQGVLGEQFLAVDPGSPERPILPEGAIVRGIDPPRLDLFLAKAYELLDTTVTGIRNNRELIGDIAQNTASLLKGANELVVDNRERVQRIVENIETLTRETNQLTRDARVRYVDNPKIARTIDNIEKVSAALEKDTKPMLADAREAIANLNRASAVVGGEAEQAKLRKAIDDVVQLAARANATAADAQSIVSHVKTGKGTVGALVMDEEVYDDLQEMVRDLKHNPWKFLWRE
jgi:phospholipid/cholesterol/gamma-HCH transport system substrate-binding protein